MSLGAKGCQVRIIGLDVSIPDSRVTAASFSSNYSIFEYDAALWHPLGSLQTYLNGYEERFRNLPSLNEHTSTRILLDIGRRKKEFMEFVEMGRPLILASTQPARLYYDTGKSETSGTGRNRQVTHLVDRLDLLNALPYELASDEANGDSLAAIDAGFGELMRKHPDYWSYNTILTKFPGRPLAVVSGTSKVVGSIGELPAGAIVIHLPACVSVEATFEVELATAFEQENEIEEDPDFESERMKAASALIDWIEAACGAEAVEVPAWLESMPFHEDVPRAAEILRVDSEISALQSKLSGIQEVRAKDNRWKRIISASGTPLESITEEAFQQLGFEILDKVPGRRDLRLKSGELYAVVEVKGVSKSASEANAAQLEKWVTEAFIEHEIHHKGILVANTWRNTPLKDRTEADFPDQMLGYATARGHVLISGVQLLSMVRAFLAGRSSSEEIRDEILRTIGRIDGWSDVAQVFSTGQASIVDSDATADPVVPQNESPSDD